MVFIETFTKYTLLINFQFSLYNNNNVLYNRKFIDHIDHYNERFINHLGNKILFFVLLILFNKALKFYIN